MSIYIFTILFLFSSSVAEVKFKITLKTKLNLLFFSYWLLVLQVGLRWETGTDWNSYLSYFENMNSFNDVQKYFKIESGYVILNVLINFISNSYSVFLLIHAVFFHYLFINGLKKYSYYVFPALLMYYVLFIGFMGSNRQLLALAICFYGLKYVIEGKKKHFILT